MSQSIGSLLAIARSARRVGTRGPLADLLEALRLRAGKQSLSVSEYFFYRLFEPSLTREDRSRFVGWRREIEIDRTLNKSSWRAVANDKLLFYASLEGLGLPYPKLRAVYSHSGRYLAGVPSLDSPAALAAFCRDPDSFPVFAKPIVGSYGRGAFAILRYDSKSDALLRGDGKRWPVTEATEAFCQPACGGYLFQDMVQPSDRTALLCGAKPTSVRVVMLLGSEGPQLFCVVWKIPTGSNMSDNFMHGQTGNLLAHVEPRSGMVTRVISGTGFELRELSHHPETGKPFAGFVLPDWEVVRQLCLRVGPCYPGLRLQHWDIALTSAGPQILEVNVEGSLDLYQLAGGRGIMDNDLAAALESAPVRSSRASGDLVGTLGAERKR